MCCSKTKIPQHISKQIPRSVVRDHIHLNNKYLKNKYPLRKFRKMCKGKGNTHDGVLF